MEVQMKKNFRMVQMFVLVILCVLSSAVVYSTPTQDNDALLGTWDITLTEMGMEMELIFKMEGDVITGEMVFDMGGAELEDITFEKGTLVFSATVDAGGQTVMVDATAEIKDDEMEGTMSTDMGEMDFTGTKRKDD
jgi:hypothetical protein